MMDEKEPIDTLNRFGVSVKGDRTLIMMPSAYMTSTEALQLAAWLVAMNDSREAEFQDLLKRVLNT